VRRRKRHRLLLIVGIVVIAIVAGPMAWVGTLMTSYLIRMKSGERITLTDIRKNASTLKDTGDVNGGVSSDDLDKLVPDGLVPEFGNRDARITIVAFIDYECPHCADLAPVLRRVMEAEKADVHLVIRDFPVIEPTASRITANAADCILAQGEEKYWRFFDELYADQTKRTRDDFLTFAKIAGADVTAFDACLSSRKYDLSIDDSLAFGKKIGVEGTPTIFVNRAKIQGAMSEDMLKSIIQRAKEALPQ
jgi:protein-disulfide isomerase